MLWLPVLEWPSAPTTYVPSTGRAQVIAYSPGGWPFHWNEYFTATVEYSQNQYISTCDLLLNVLSDLAPWFPPYPYFPHSCLHGMEKRRWYGWHLTCSTSEAANAPYKFVSLWDGTKSFCVCLRACEMCKVYKYVSETSCWIQRAQLKSFKKC